MSNIADRIVDFVQSKQPDENRYMSVRLSNGDSVSFSSVLSYENDVLVIKAEKRTHFVDANSIVDFVVHD